MNTLFENPIGCPYCGETISIMIDGSVSRQEYIEDCQVCCRPITIRIQIAGDGSPQVTVLDENEF